jgi:hypothetical protein
MYFPPIQEILQNISIYVDVVALDLTDWIICIIAALIPLITLETAKWVNRVRGQYY